MRRLYNNRGLILTIVAFVFFAGFYLWFLQTPAFQKLLIWSQQNIIVFVLLLFFFKIISIVYAPLSGGLMTLASIPILGWPLAYLVDLVGSLVGGSLAYGIGHRYGLRFIQSMFGHESAQKISRIKFRHTREFEGILVMRLLGSSLSDFICYGAGLFKVKYHNFLLASLVAHPIVGVPTFYFSGLAFSGQNSWLGILLLVISLSALYKFKGRYFE